MSWVCEETSNSMKLGMLKLISGILEEIRAGQMVNMGLVDRLVLINQGKGCDFRIDDNGVTRFSGRVCI